MPSPVVCGNQTFLAACIGKGFFVAHQLVIDRILHFIPCSDRRPAAEILGYRRGHMGTEYVIFAVRLKNGRIVHADPGTQFRRGNSFQINRKIQIRRRLLCAGICVFVFFVCCRFPGSSLCSASCFLLSVCFRLSVCSRNRLRRCLPRILRTATSRQPHNSRRADGTHIHDLLSSHTCLLLFPLDFCCCGRLSLSHLC